MNITTSPIYHYNSGDIFEQSFVKENPKKFEEFKAAQKAERELKLFLPVKGITELIWFLECERCLGNPKSKSYLCQKGLSWCDECVSIVINRKESKCSLHEYCKFLRERQNFLLNKLRIFLKDHLAIFANDNPVGMMIDSSILVELENMVQCRCKKSLFGSESIFFCANGHALCENCERCRGKCQGIKIRLFYPSDNKFKFVQNKKAINICKLVKNLNCPTLFKCRIQNCTENLPLEMLKEHVKKRHLVENLYIQDITDGYPTKFYKIEVDIEHENQRTYGLVSDKGELVFFTPSLVKQIGLVLKFIPLQFEVAENHLQEVLCTVRIRQNVTTYEAESKNTMFQLKNDIPDGYEYEMRVPPHDLDVGSMYTLMSKVKNFIFVIHFGSMQDLVLKKSKKV